jgi:hypothetical protein
VTERVRDLDYFEQSLACLKTSLLRVSLGHQELFGVLQVDTHVRTQTPSSAIKVHCQFSICHLLGTYMRCLLVHPCCSAPGCCVMKGVAHDGVCGRVDCRKPTTPSTRKGRPRTTGTTCRNCKTSIRKKYFWGMVDVVNAAATCEWWNKSGSFIHRQFGQPLSAARP